MRVAALDLGTNTTRLLVADVTNGSLEEVVRRSQITRLGEGVDARRRLLPLPITRVRNCLADYRRELEALGAERALAVATSAIRVADNGEAFLGEVEWSYGFKTRLLSGEDEAQLTLRGVASGRGLDGHALVIDVGGGSTELIAGSPESVALRISTDLGSVRLTERYLRATRPARASSRSARRRSARYSASACPTRRGPPSRRRSAWPGRSRRSRRSTSASSSTTPSAWTATG